MFFQNVLNTFESKVYFGPGFFFHWVLGIWIIEFREFGSFILRHIVVDPLLHFGK